MAAYYVQVVALISTLYKLAEGTPSRNVMSNLFFLVIKDAAVASINTTVSGLFANTGYSFRVIAVNEFGAGVPSVESGMCVTRLLFYAIGCSSDSHRAATVPDSCGRQSL